MAGSDPVIIPYKSINRILTNMSSCMVYSSFRERGIQFNLSGVQALNFRKLFSEITVDPKVPPDADELKNFGGLNEKSANFFIWAI